jgi:hypothetical protein
MVKVFKFYGKSIQITVKSTLMSLQVRLDGFFTVF